MDSALVVSPARRTEVVSVESVGDVGLGAEVSALIAPGVVAGFVDERPRHPANRTTTAARADALRKIEALTRRPFESVGLP